MNKYCFVLELVCKYYRLYQYLRVRELCFVSVCLYSPGSQPGGVSASWRSISDLRSGLLERSQSTKRPCPELQAAVDWEPIGQGTGRLYHRLNTTCQCALLNLQMQLVSQLTPLFWESVKFKHTDSYTHHWNQWYYVTVHTDQTLFTEHKPLNAEWKPCRNTRNIIKRFTLTEWSVIHPMCSECGGEWTELQDGGTQ